MSLHNKYQQKNAVRKFIAIYYAHSVCKLQRILISKQVVL
jgi:hypothetical protein